MWTLVYKYLPDEDLNMTVLLSVVKNPNNTPYRHKINNKNKMCSFAQSRVKTNRKRA